MDEAYQLSFEDIEWSEHVKSQPRRIAYIDECGHFGFDFEKAQTSKYLILCAIIVKDSQVEKLHKDFLEIKRTNGFGDAELKSSKLNDKQRKRIMFQLLALDFNTVIFVADKQAFLEGSPLTKYNKVFIKNMSQRLYELLYHTYPNLKIIQDKMGTQEFQESFKSYVESNRTSYNLFNEYEFDFVDSKDEILVQLADFIAGSVNKSLLNQTEIDYIRMLKGKTIAMEYFPRKNEPYFGRKTPEECRYDKGIFALAVKCATDYIFKNKGDESDEKRAQVATLQYLLSFVFNFDSTKYIYSDELVKVLQEVLDRKVSKDFLFRKVIAPLRDHGVILASSVHGYKIPISVDDIYTYLNSTSSIVSPMMNRMGICRKLILQSTDNEFDVFNDSAFIKYRRYFDDLS